MAVLVRCRKCGTQYKLVRKPESGELTCKKCGAVISLSESSEAENGQALTASAASAKTARSASTPPTSPKAKTAASSPIEQKIPAGALKGRTISGYLFTELLYAGERTELYKADQVAMGRAVAVRALKPEVAQDDNARAEFIEQARAVAAFHNPAIVSIYHVNSEGTPFFSMEYIEGSDVHEMLAGAGLPPWTQAVRITQEIGSGVVHALHNAACTVNIASDTVLVSSKGEAKILPSAFALAGLTSTGIDEQAAFKLVEFLYLLLTGRQAGDAAKATPPRSLNPKVPPALSDTVVTLLREAKKGRLASAEVLQALRHLTDRSSRTLSHAGTHAGRPPSGKKASLKTKLAALGIIVVLVLLSAGGIFMIVKSQKVRQDFESLRLAYARKQYVTVLNLGKTFLDAHPSHPQADDVRKWLKDAEEVNERRNRTEQFRKLVMAVPTQAKDDVENIRSYYDKIDELLEENNDVDGAERIAEEAARSLDTLFSREFRRRRRECERALATSVQNRKLSEEEEQLDDLSKGLIHLRNRDYETATEKVKELEDFYTRSEILDLDARKSIQELEEMVLRQANSDYYWLVNKEMTFLQQDRRGEVIELYEMMAGNWGIADVAQMAKTRLTMLRPTEQGTEEQEEEQEEETQEEDGD